MNYCILRAEKLTAFGSIGGSAKHTFREIPTPNADPARTHLNKTIGAQDAASVRAAIKARLPAKRRKDAVLCIEYLITASPEWFKGTTSETHIAYFNASMRWLRERHGKDNVVCLNAQYDETSPHLVAYVVPLTKDGRLSAKDFLGGRKVLSEMQTDFAERVGKPVGLQRGVEGSKATHTTAKQYAAALNKNPTLAPPKPPTPSFTDRITGKAKQAEEEHAVTQAQYGALVQRAASVAQVSQRARNQQAEALEQLRKNVKEAKQHELEAAQLREENARLVREMREQRTYFQRQIEDLKAQLAKALDQVKGFLQKIGLLTGERDRAEAEAEELREVLYPTDSQSPGLSEPRSP